MSDSHYSSFFKQYPSKPFPTSPHNVPFSPSFKQNIPGYYSPKSTQPILRNFDNRTSPCKCSKNPDLNSTFHFYSSRKQQRLKTESAPSNSHIMQVLLEENSNLKEQNKYLQKQLSKSKGNESELSEALIEYENIMSILNSQNSRLHKEILYLSQNATDKVDELKSTVTKFFKKAKKNYERQQIKESKEYSNMSSFTPQQEEQNIMFHRRNKSGRHEVESRDSSEIELREHSNCHPRRQSNQSETFIDGNCPFEEMLDECRREPDPKRRKWMRKKLAEYTYKRASK